MQDTTALVVLSGGQDSTTCLAWARQNFSKLVAVTFDYGQRHRKEIMCAKKIAKDFNCEKHFILDMSLLNDLAPNALTRNSIEVAAGENGELPTTFVDGRNMLFLTFAAVLAKQLKIRCIVTGVCQTDFSGYPDCRDVFIKSLNTTLNLAMDYNFEILTPLMWLDKKQTWALADKMGELEYIAKNTLTCYNGVMGEGCGECPSCKLRNKGLTEYLESVRGDNK
jgi:7-cyano-7-deazaguanine synthase